MVANDPTPRVVLAGRPIPALALQVRDDQARTWFRAADQRWHTADGRHHATSSELSLRTDLVVLDELEVAA